MTILGPFAMLEAGDVIRVACPCGRVECSVRAHVLTTAGERRECGWIVAQSDAGYAFVVLPGDEIEILEALGARGDFAS